MPVNPRIMFATNSNFMQTRGNLPTAIKVMRQADMCVSMEIKFSLTAQFADIILPVATHWEGNDDPAWGELCWPSPFGDGNGQKQRKDALLAWRPLVKPMYECREEKAICREIVERMGFDPDAAYPKSNYDQWLGYFLGMRELSEDLERWEPVITWTAADNERYGANYPEQQGKVGFEQFMADGAYVVERSAGDRRNYVGYRDDKLGIGPDGEVIVADPAWPRPSQSGKLEIYCQFKADNANRTGLNPEPIKPYANYFAPNRGYQETFDDWDAKVKGAYPLQAYTPHYMRRAHTCYDNMVWTQEAFVNPVFDERPGCRRARHRGRRHGHVLQRLRRNAAPRPAARGHDAGHRGHPARGAVGARRERPRTHHRPGRKRADALGRDAVELLPAGGRVQLAAHRHREVRRRASGGGLRARAVLGRGRRSC